MSKNNNNSFVKKNDWSIIKDKLLQCYLMPYFQKVLMTGKPIYYVDCFSGKGKFDDGTDGSPLIALRIRDICLSQSRFLKKAGAIKTCFIDKNYGTELSLNIDSAAPTYDKPEVISGKFEDNIEKCLRDKQGYNVFLYIDPYGIKALDSNLFDKFQSYGFTSLEMLINFNSFGFFRDACRVMKVDCQNDSALNDLEDLVEYDPTTVDSTTQSMELLSRIAGGDYWKQIVIEFNKGTLDGYAAEQRLSYEYKQELKKRYTYVLDMPIRLKANQRPKYRMIHVCDHEAGCFLMAQNMQKRKDELFINIQQDGQLSLYNMTSLGSSSAEGETYTRNEILEKVKQHLKVVPSCIGITKFLASFMTENGLICEFKMIYDILNELSASGVIDIIRQPSKTLQKHPTTFWEEKKGRSVTIRRR